MAVKIDLVEVDYYLKQVFHLLHDKCFAPVEALLYLYFISYDIIYILYI